MLMHFNKMLCFRSEISRFPLSECSGWDGHQCRQWKNLGLWILDFWEKDNYTTFIHGTRKPISSLCRHWLIGVRVTAPRERKGTTDLSDISAAVRRNCCGLKAAQTVVAIAWDLQYYLIIFSQNLKEGHSIFCWDFINTSFLCTIWKHSSAHTSK